MSIFVKICGITEVGAGIAAARAGADAVGFVFASSPRQISPGDAVLVSGELPPALLRVAVFRDPTLEEVEEVLERFTPDLVQADHSSLSELRGVEVLPVYRPGDPTPADGSWFLFEGRESGVGQMTDLDEAARAAGIGKLVLAGGLTPDNVGSAIEKVRPHGVDVSSGVESAPGVKDTESIHSFVAAVRAAEERLVSA